jgi:hypothetical protein
MTGMRDAIKPKLYSIHMCARVCTAAGSPSQLSCMLLPSPWNSCRGDKHIIVRWEPSAKLKNIFSSAFCAFARFVFHVCHKLVKSRVLLVAITKEKSSHEHGKTRKKICQLS